MTEKWKKMRIAPLPKELVDEICRRSKEDGLVPPQNLSKESRTPMEKGWRATDYDYDNFLACGIEAVLEYGDKTYFVTSITSDRSVDIYEVPDMKHFAGYRDKPVAHYDDIKSFYGASLFGKPIKEIFDESIIEIY